MELTFLIATPLLAAFFIFLLPAAKIRLIEATVALASLLNIFLVTRLVPEVLAEKHIVASELFALDMLGTFLVLLIALIGFFVSWYSIGYLRQEVGKGIIGPRRVRQYFILMELFLFAMYLAVGTTNPIIMWIAIEATTLATAFLISFYNKPSATEAAWKYIMLNSLGLLLGLLGTLLFLSLPDLRSGEITWEAFRAEAGNFHPLAAKIAFIFILVGYGTKMGLAPLHAWLPDAYSKAPSPIAALLTGVLSNVALFAVLRFKGVADIALAGSDFTGNLLIFFGMFSLVIASLIIFIQQNYKRLLAYSSIEHMGIAALGFGFGGLGTYAALLHMLYHSLAKSLMFLLSGNIFLRFSSTKLKNVKGVLQVLPVSGTLFFGGFLMLSGLPPFGTFSSKFLLFSGGVAEHPYVVGAALFLVALVFFGFLKQVSALAFGEADPAIVRGEQERSTLLPVLFLAVVILVFSLALPPSIENLIRESASQFIAAAK